MHAHSPRSQPYPGMHQKKKKKKDRQAREEVTSPSTLLLGSSIWSTAFRPGAPSAGNLLEVLEQAERRAIKDDQAIEAPLL